MRRPYTKWKFNGAVAWSAGLNHSEGDAWQLCLGGSLGTETGSTEFLYALPPTVVTRGVTGTAKPFRLGSYTVDALPVPRTVDADAMVYVPNASGGPKVASWDGSAWRMVGALGAVVS